MLFQTVVPAVVGVIIFGDAVRDGWWPAAAVGFVVSTAGALALRDAEAMLEHIKEPGHERVTDHQRG